MHIRSIDFLVEILPGLLQLGDPDVSGLLDGEYYWNLKNKGIKHLQIRFYKIRSRDWEQL